MRTRVIRKLGNFITTRKMVKKDKRKKIVDDLHDQLAQNKKTTELLSLTRDHGTWIDMSAYAFVLVLEMNYTGFL